MQKAYKQRIKDKGLKTTWIAEQLKISQPSLSMFLSGKRPIPYEVECRLKKLLYV
jgi:predicted transcriptional regulator